MFDPVQRQWPNHCTGRIGLDSRCQYPGSTGGVVVNQFTEKGVTESRIPISQQNKNFVDLGGGKLDRIMGISQIREILMHIDYRSEAPQIIRDFLTYHQTIQGHSRKTVDEYFLDLRNFFRFIKLERGLVPTDAVFQEISIFDVDLDLVRSVTLTDVYNYMDYLSRDRPVHQNSRLVRNGVLHGCIV